VNALTTLLNNAQQVMDEVNEAQTAYDNITNTRELNFKRVRQLGSQILSVLKSSGAHALTIDDARASARKLWGTSKKSASMATNTPEPKAADEKPTPAFAFSRDYASMAFYFDKLVQTVSAEPKYAPTEPELSVAGLQAKSQELRGLNDAVAQAEIAMASARRKRNALLYKDEGSLFSTAVATKNYVRGAFGFSSDQRAEVSRIRFTKPNA
ncbi:MAG TPA: hypothetical protein VGQ59_21300, partial [Cyclobacteriaceae bacterium]|jgi:hypothetical protein|nr:hypothetical protein [Cyclobacteriaceae bacterium]